MSREKGCSQTVAPQLGAASVPQGLGGKHTWAAHRGWSAALPPKPLMGTAVYGQFSGSHMHLQIQTLVLEL